jgi:predicted phosphohydrolase
MIATSYKFSSEKLVVSWHSPCTRTPWKMMDRPRDCVVVKGCLSWRVRMERGRELHNVYDMVVGIMRVCQKGTMS